MPNSDSPLGESTTAAIAEHALLRMSGALEEGTEHSIDSWLETLEFLLMLVKHGVQGALLAGMATDAHGEHRRGHFAVLVENDMVVDWGAKEYLLCAPVPMVVSLQEWKQRWQYTCITYA